MGCKYEAMYGVHENEEHIHIHIAMNSVSYVDGSRYYGRKKEFYGLLKDIGEILKCYGIYKFYYQNAEGGFIIMKIKNQELRNQFIDVFHGLTQRYNSHQVWSDFVIMSACTISNACDLRFYKEREEMYMDTVKRYKKEELDSFCEMLSLLIMALTEEPCQDFLGEIYCNLRLANGHRGQVFTPYYVAEMMARMMVSGKINDITEK